MTGFTNSLHFYVATCVHFSSLVCTQGNCDAGVFVVAAAAAPFLFTSFALGGVYCKRLLNMWDSEDTGSGLDVYADFGATQFGH